MPEPVGVWQGSREPNAEYFDDVMGNNEDTGIFTGSDGMQDYDGLKPSKTREEVTVKMHCRMCNNGLVVGIEWPELYLIATSPQTGLLPRGWQRSAKNAAAFPADIKCGGPCGGAAIPLMVPPDWAKQQIANAINQNLITEEWLMAQPPVQALLAEMQRRTQMQQGGGR